MNYAKFNDMLMSGAHMDTIYVEDLVKVSKIIEKLDMICCIVDKDKFFELYKSKQRNGYKDVIDDFEDAYEFLFSDGDITVANTYFDIIIKQFTKQIVVFRTE